MVQENEVFNLIIAVVVGVFFLWNWRRIRTLHHLPLLISAFLALLLGWIATIAEGYWLPELLNAVEHSLYALGMVLVAAWCWRIAARREGNA